MPIHAFSHLFHRRHGICGSRRAFSLIELIVVMGVIIVVAAISVPMFRNMGAGGAQFSRALIEVQGLAETARQYAVTQNTYTWLAMANVTEPDGQKTLHVAVFTSKDGTDPSPWSAYGTVPNNSIGLATQTRFFKQVILSDAASVTVSDIPTLPATPVVTAANSPSNGTAVFTVTTPQGTVQYNRCIQFSASGDARNSSASTAVIEFALQPQRGTTAAGDVAKAAVFRISSVTGGCTVYRRQ